VDNVPRPLAVPRPVNHEVDSRLGVEPFVAERLIGRAKRDRLGLDPFDATALCRLNNGGGPGSSK
jgi:hypothetical protein